MLFVLLLSLASAAPGDRPSDDSRGDDLYARHCVQCHGAQARGDGPVAGALLTTVPDLAGALRDDVREEQVETILSGRGFMPGFSLSFDRYDARRVWRAMKRASEREVPAPPPADPDTDTDSDS